MNKIELEKEKKYLQLVLKLLKKYITENDIKTERIAHKILEMQKYYWENKSEIDAPERISLENDVRVNVNSEELTSKKNLLYIKMLENPYFGRIDFNCDEQEIAEKIYVGLTSLIDDNFEIFVYDWRAPIASLFYDYELGEASYKIENDEIKGNINLKRQYKIEKGQLKYAFDSSININDEILQETLSDNSTDKMKSIVSTIQKEQNKVIRDIADSCIIVEGAAGSGKTSVAMHRIAYLLYKFRDSLKENETLIFSPNEIFSQYISDVLPELGERNVLYTAFTDYFDSFISEYSKVEKYMDFIERIYNIEYSSEAKVIKMKLDERFIKLMDNYIERISSKKRFNPIKIGRDFSVSANQLDKLYRENYTRIPPFLRIKKIIDYITMKYSHETEGVFDKKLLAKKISDKFEYPIDFKEVMLEMYNDKKFKEELALITENITAEKFCEISKRNLLGSQLKYEDASILVYLKGMLHGFGSDNSIKQVVIDEAQDYTKLQYIIMKKLFKKAKFTILGDSNQAINPLFEYEKLSEVQSVFKEMKTKYLQLNTAYRNTYEITKYVNEILGLENINLIGRHGESPTLEMNVAKEKSLDLILKQLKQNLESNKKTGIITRTTEDVKTITSALEEKKIHHASYDKKQKEWSDVLVLPIYYAKGLEFDAVIIYDSIDNPFISQYPKMFYVACTRALHKLDIISENEIDFYKNQKEVGYEKNICKTKTKIN